MAIQLKDKGQTINGVFVPGFTVITGLAPSVEATLVQGGDATPLLQAPGLVPAFFAVVNGVAKLLKPDGTEFLGGGASVVQVNPTDVTASRALAAADFGAGILRVNAAGVVALTLPTVAALGLAATPNQVRVLPLQVVGAGIPTFAGATSGTAINGVAGPTTVLPLGGAPVQNGLYVLQQAAPGADAWLLS